MTEDLCVSITGEIDGDAAESFREDLFRLESSSYLDVIPVYLDSPGGEVYHGLTIVNAIRTCPKPVVTICTGHAMSMAAVILAAGHQRWIAHHATVMVHTVWSGEVGKAEDLEIAVREVRRLRDMLRGMLDDFTASKPGFWASELAKIDNADLYLTPPQAKDYNLVDAIGVPRLRCRYDLVTHPTRSPGSYGGASGV